MFNAISCYVDVSYAPLGATHAVVMHVPSDTRYFNGEGITTNNTVWERHVGTDIYEWTGDKFTRVSSQGTPSYARLIEEYIRVVLPQLPDKPSPESDAIDAAILLLVKNGWHVSKQK
jgi:hypothetical protein